MKHCLIDYHIQMASILLAAQNSGLNFVRRDSGNHDDRIELINEFKIETFDDPICECDHIPMIKKGIEQKAQWANKPHKRKR